MFKKTLSVLISTALFNTVVFAMNPRDRKSSQFSSPIQQKETTYEDIDETMKKIACGISEQELHKSLDSPIFDTYNIESIFDKNGKFLSAEESLKTIIRRHIGPIVVKDLDRISLGNDFRNGNNIKNFLNEVLTKTGIKIGYDILYYSYNKIYGTYEIKSHKYSHGNTTDANKVLHLLSIKTGTDSYVYLEDTNSDGYRAYLESLSEDWQDQCKTLTYKDPELAKKVLDTFKSRLELSESDDIIRFINRVFERFDSFTKNPSVFVRSEPLTFYHNNKSALPPAPKGYRYYECDVFDKQIQKARHGDRGQARFVFCSSDSNYTFKSSKCSKPPESLDLNPLLKKNIKYIYLTLNHYNKFVCMYTSDPNAYPLGAVFPNK